MKKTKVVIASAYSHSRVAATPLPAPQPCPHTGRMLYPMLRGDGRVVWTGVQTK